jgi:prepilin-type N-terminal cleavage/methylation domain-containing protein
MLKCNKGVTLIELLAALSLLSIVVLLAGSIHLFGLTQTKNKTNEIQNQSNVRLAINVISKEIRSAKSGPENVIVSIPNTELQITTINNSIVIYKLGINKILLKNNQSFISNINEFKLDKSTDKITITITSNDSPPISLSNTIYFRK